jgi:hypothetical protein
MDAIPLDATEVAPPQAQAASHVCFMNYTK